MSLLSAQVMSAQNGKGKEGKGNDNDQPPPFYNPYPPGILPSDLTSEIARVLREVDVIEAEALTQLQLICRRRQRLTHSYSDFRVRIEGLPPKCREGFYRAVHSVGRDHLLLHGGFDGPSWHAIAQQARLRPRPPLAPFESY